MFEEKGETIEIKPPQIDETPLPEPSPKVSEYLRESKVTGKVDVTDGDDAYKLRALNVDGIKNRLRTAMDRADKTTRKSFDTPNFKGAKIGLERLLDEYLLGEKIDGVEIDLHELVRKFSKKTGLQL